MLSPTGNTEESESLLSVAKTRSYGAASTIIDGDVSGSPNNVDGAVPGREKSTPLPYRQLSLIFFMRLPELIAYFQIFPVRLSLRNSIYSCTTSTKPLISDIQYINDVSTSSYIDCHALC